MQPSDFAFGGHRDKDDEAIGTFGEGFKLFALVAARERKKLCFKYRWL
jgi:hypothetical protein